MQLLRRRAPKSPAKCIRAVHFTTGNGGSTIQMVLFTTMERRKLPRYSEMSISIIMSAGIGLAGVLSGFVKNSANFNSFLFGDCGDQRCRDDFSHRGVRCGTCVIFCFYIKSCFIFHWMKEAHGWRACRSASSILSSTIMIAVTVSVARRTVGALMVSSMMVVPVACAMHLGKNFKQTVWYAVGLNVLFMIIGLFAAFYLGLKPGGTIVLVGVAALLIILSGNGLCSESRNKVAIDTGKKRATMFAVNDD